MATIVISITKKGKEALACIGERELETADITFTKNGSVSLKMNALEVIDPYYLTVPKEFEKLHMELCKVLKTVAEVDKFYRFMLSMDSIRKKNFSDFDLLPYYIVPIVTSALVKHHAFIVQNGTYKKTELFTRFLIYRDETVAEAIGGFAASGKLKNLEQVTAEEERAARKYRLPPMHELKEMNYEMLTMEMAKAEEMMAKPKIIKVLKNLRAAKSATKIRKTEKQVMDEAIREEREAQEEENEPVPMTRLAKHQKRKAEQARKDKVRFEKSNGKGPKVAVVNSPEGEYVG